MIQLACFILTHQTVYCIAHLHVADLIQLQYLIQEGNVWLQLLIVHQHPMELMLILKLTHVLYYVQEYTQFQFHQTMFVIVQDVHSFGTPQHRCITVSQVVYQHRQQLLYPQTEHIV